MSGTSTKNRVSIRNSRKNCCEPVSAYLADPEYSVHSKDALQDWLDLIRARGLPGVLEKLAGRSEEAFRMRQSSPFAVVMPQDERVRILRRYEALRPRTHPAGV
jgi:hypothetical protein